MHEEEFNGYISTEDDLEYIAKNILKWAKSWVSEKKFPECKLIRPVRVKIVVSEERNDD